MAIYNGDKQIHELYNGDTYIEELYNGDTKIFDAGWDTQITGTSPLSLPNARAKSTSWKIEGQSSQSGTPTPTSPLDVYGVGDLSGSNYVVPILKANNCGVVDLGALNWTMRTDMGANIFAHSSLNKVSGVSNVYIDDNSYVLNPNGHTALTDKQYCGYATNYIIIKDTNYTDASTFKQAMSGKYLYYQRTTDTTWNIPTTTNINLPAPLQKIGTYKDSIESDGTLTRGVGVKVFDGTEPDNDWQLVAPNRIGYQNLTDLAELVDGDKTGLCSHYINHGSSASGQALLSGEFNLGVGATSRLNFARFSLVDTEITTIADFKSWLAAQYANGTPVTIYYPLATEVESSVEVPTINTVKGQNYIDIETEIQPSNVSMTYRKKQK